MNILGLASTLQYNKFYANATKSKVGFDNASSFASYANTATSNKSSGHHTTVVRPGNYLRSIETESGQSIYLNYDKSSTKEDPVMLATGTDINGNDYETKIHLNDIDPNWATVMEMEALRVHIGQQNKDSFKSGNSNNNLSGAIFNMEAMNKGSVWEKQNFVQQYESEIAKYQLAGFHDKVNSYMEELKNYLLFSDHSQKKYKAIHLQDV